MKVAEIKVSSILSKTQIPVADYVINPYVGCSHGCLYCYARFMKRFTGHREAWGDFLDIKLNAPELVPIRGNYEEKKILLSSVTDPYLPQENEYLLTRGVLEKLVHLEPSINILTKSNLVLRDLDIIKQFPDREIGFSISSMDNFVQKKVERHSPHFNKRLSALKKIRKHGIRTYLFISPILPYLTDWKSIIRAARDNVDYFMFENLNIAGSVWGPVKHWLEIEHPDLVEDVRNIYFGDSLYWEEVEGEIIDYCQEKGLKYRMYFHH
jgi:DNA repair photolyase